MLESRAERSALGAAPDIEVVDAGLELSECENLTAESHDEQTKR